MLVNKFFTLAGVFVVAKIADRAYDREVRNFYLNNSTGIPYFENEENVVDLDRTFWRLDEDQKDQPTLFYPGRQLNFQPSGLL